MNQLVLTLALTALLQACAERPHPTILENNNDSHPGGAILQHLPDLEIALSQRDICTVPPSEGPCSLACDPEQLSEQYVPEGTCVTFVCTTTDGMLFGVSACRPPAP